MDYGKLRHALAIIGAFQAAVHYEDGSVAVYLTIGRIIRLAVPW